MESNFAEVLDSDRRVIVDLKSIRNNITHYSALNSSSLKLGKRKQPDECISFQRSLPQYYTNFTKSGLPKRLMFSQNGGWVDHDSKIIAMVRKEFELGKATVEVKISGQHLIFDFLRMSQFNFGTSLERPIAWIDDYESCFFPEIYADVDEQYGSFPYTKPEEELSSSSARNGMQRIKLQIEIEVNGSGADEDLEYFGETSPLVKRIKLGENANVEDKFDKESDLSTNEGVGESLHLEKIAYLDVKKPDMHINSETVKKMFLESMNVVDGVKVVSIGSHSGSMWHDRSELFLKQAEITEYMRGNANIRYAWLESTKEVSSGMMVYGFGHFGLQQIKSTNGVGIHLTVANCANSSAKYCDVDENGVRYMVLCRVIMGNMEMIHAGSKQFHPSNENFDSGVDDLENPRQYVVWGMNINTHIYPEYVVSFKVSGNREASVPVNDQKHETLVMPVRESTLYNPSKVGAATDMVSDHQSDVTGDGNEERTTSLNSTTIRVPKSPWMPFPVLLAGISKQVPSSNMKVLRTHYEKFKNKVISRVDFVNYLRLIVGDTILKTAILELNSKVTPNNGTFMGKQNQDVAG